MFTPFTLHASGLTGKLYQAVLEEDPTMVSIDASGARRPVRVVHKALSDSLESEISSPPVRADTSGQEQAKKRNQPRRNRNLHVR